MEHPREYLMNKRDNRVLRNFYDALFDVLPNFNEILSRTPKMSLIYKMKSEFEQTKSLTVIPVGIEPTSQLPQSCVLSIERRDHNWSKF